MNIPILLQSTALSTKYDTKHRNVYTRPNLAASVFFQKMRRSEGKPADSPTPRFKWATTAHPPTATLVSLQIPPPALGRRRCWRAHTHTHKPLLIPMFEEELKSIILSPRESITKFKVFPFPQN